jgi:hypothetical protein
VAITAAAIRIVVQGGEVMATDTALSVYKNGMVGLVLVAKYVIRLVGARDTAAGTTFNLDVEHLYFKQSAKNSHSAPNRGFDRSFVGKTTRVTVEDRPEEVGGETFVQMTEIGIDPGVEGRRVHAIGPPQPEAFAPEAQIVEAIPRKVL